MAKTKHKLNGWKAQSWDPKVTTENGALQQMQPGPRRINAVIHVDWNSEPDAVIELGTSLKIPDVKSLVEISIMK